MQDTVDVHPAPAPDGGPLLDFERLDVYRVALEFQALATSITLPSGRRELRDQLDRAALSIVLNTAEGAGRSSSADRARFFAMARGSAMECAAVLDVLAPRVWPLERPASVAEACWFASYRCTRGCAFG